ncbi:Bacteriophage VT1-Sakai, H0018 [uncultured Caudovirales phage]|uniref:Bacteriophage VT1-Sakai, H0018 n=1 Tax=uncultured Caudovirales phage TaxID=2100421 RepID=A0A6J7WU70_9CAUD|nr:Bacteriophage VT1-Sakai, H0018 [uncultured Caudovirales phage]
MSFKAVGTDITLVASGDLSANQYKVVKLDSNGRSTLAGASDLAQIGIQQDKPTALGQPSSVRMAGISKALAGGTIAIGDRVTSDANGKVITATTGKQVIGIALAAAVANDIFAMVIDQRGVV